jgi:hypothetical protein
MASICRTALSPAERSALISLFVCDLKRDAPDTFGDTEGTTEDAFPTALCRLVLLAPLLFKQLTDPFTLALVAAEELIVLLLV